MKRTTLLAVLLFAAAALPARQLTSPLGFRIDVPDTWLVLSREEAKNNPDLFESFPAGEMSPDLVRSIREQIAAGGVEFYFRRRTRPQGFVDNVNLFKQLQDTPTTPVGSAQFCRLGPAAFSKAYGHPVSFHACEVRSVSGCPALYLEFDGARRGTQSVQYQIATSPSVAIIATLTARQERVAEVEGEFRAMISSLRLTASCTASR